MTSAFMLNPFLGLSGVGNTRRDERILSRKKNQNSENYFQIVISNRHSSGSDKYSVIEERDNINTSENKDTIEKDTKDNLANADGVSDYSIIDVTGLVPRSVNCSPLSLQTFLTGPDLIKDLPAATGRRVGRSISFLSQGEGQRMQGRMGRQELIKTGEMMRPEQGQTGRVASKQGALQRSMSAVTERYRPRHR